MTRKLPVYRLTDIATLDLVLQQAETLGEELTK